MLREVRGRCVQALSIPSNKIAVHTMPEQASVISQKFFGDFLGDVCMQSCDHFTPIQENTANFV